MSNYVHNKNYIKRKRANAATTDPPKNSAEKKNMNCRPFERANGMEIIKKQKQKTTAKKNGSA